jgi:small subunit ribosomal protein S16
MLGSMRASGWFCPAHYRPELTRISPVREEDLKGFTPVLMIRLARFGARKQPYYRVVVIEKDRARNGRSIEVVGTYNPRTNPATVDLKRERIQHWTSNGAQLSERVAKLLAAYTPAATAA